MFQTRRSVVLIALAVQPAALWRSAPGYSFRYGVRRQGFWNQWQLKLRENLAHLVGFIMRRAGGDASVALRVSFV
jgi:hypothetical protein